MISKLRALHIDQGDINGHRALDVNANKALQTRHIDSNILRNLRALNLGGRCSVDQHMWYFLESTS